MSVRPCRSVAVRVTRVVAALAVALPALSGATVVASYGDGEFLDSAWTSMLLWDTTPAHNASQTTTRLAAGGHPGAAQQTSLHFNTTGTGGIQGVAAGHLFSGAVYDPSVHGGIASVKMTLDQRSVAQIGATPGTFHGLLAQQAGTLFIRLINPAAESTAWQSIASADLVAGLFHEVLPTGYGPALPDFSRNGAPIQFGYASVTALGPGPSGGFTIVSAVDNWGVTVTSVPEPGALALVLAAGGGATWAGRRRPVSSAQGRA